MQVLDVRGQFLAAVAEAVQEVLHVGKVLLAAAVPRGFVAVVLGRHQPAAAVQEQHALRAVELHAVPRAVGKGRAMVVHAVPHRVDVRRNRCQFS